MRRRIAISSRRARPSAPRCDSRRCAAWRLPLRLAQPIAAGPQGWRQRLRAPRRTAWRARGAGPASKADRLDDANHPSGHGRNAVVADRGQSKALGRAAAQVTDVAIRREQHEWARTVLEKRDGLARAGSPSGPHPREHTGPAVQLGRIERSRRRLAGRLDL